MRRHPFLVVSGIYILLGAGFGLGFMVAVLLGATKEPEVIVKERWMFNSTTTTIYEYMPRDDLSHLAHEGPCYRVGNIESGYCPTTTTTLAPPPPSTVPVTSPPTTVQPPPTTTTVTTVPSTTTTLLPETTTTTIVEETTTTTQETVLE